MNLGVVFAQLGEGEIDHSIAFVSRKLFDANKNYKTMEREGIVMIYALQKFRNYLLGSHFKFFTNHSILKYQVNKPVLGGRIFRWFLLCQEFEFQVIVKLGKYNVGPDHLSRLQSREAGGSRDDVLLDALLFRVEAVDDHFLDIIA